MSAAAPVLYRGLPVNLDAERLVLGSVLLDGSRFIEVANLTEQDFGIDKHRKIWRRIAELHSRNEVIDRITVCNELANNRELEAVDGVSYVVSLDDGLPRFPSLESYVGIVQEKARLRKAIYLGQSIVNKATLGADSSQEILESAAEEIARIEDGRGRADLLSAASIIDNYPGGINALMDPSTAEPGLATGFSKFDEMTGGLRGGELVILAARPSMGKTAMALNIAAFAAIRRQKKVAIFSLEMSRESLLHRLMCAEAHVDSQRFRMGYLNSDDRRRLAQATGRIHQASLHIDDAAMLTAADVHSKCRKLKAEKGLDLAIVDYLQLMSGHDAKNRNDVVSAMSRALKLAAKDLDIPLVALSQLSRGPETRPGTHRPVLSDLRDSGSIEQDADLVGFIFREEVYKPDREDLKGEATLILAKQRNGPVGDIRLVWIAPLQRFENRADEQTVQGEPSE